MLYLAFEFIFVVFHCLNRLRLLLRPHTHHRRRLHNPLLLAIPGTHRFLHMSQLRLDLQRGDHHNHDNPLAADMNTLADARSTLSAGHFEQSGKDHGFSASESEA